MNTVSDYQEPLQGLSEIIAQPQITQGCPVMSVSIYTVAVRCAANAACGVAEVFYQEALMSQGGVLGVSAGFY